MTFRGFGGGGFGGGVPNIARAGVKIIPDTDGFDRELGSAIGNALTFGTAFGSGLLLAGLSAAFTSAIQGATAFAEFEQSLTGVQNQAGLTADEMGQLEQAVLKFGPELGLRPQAIADGLGSVVSGAVDAEENILRLEAAARLAAIGLGDLDDTGSAIRTSLQLFGDESLDAASSAEVFLGAVQEGGIALDDLEDAILDLGPVIGPLNIQFDEFAAFLLAARDAGFEVNDVTGLLEGTLRDLIEPTGDLEDVFTRLGTSTEEMRTTIRDQGLLQGLLDLNAAIAAGGDEFEGSLPRLDQFQLLMGALTDDLPLTIERMNSLTGTADRVGTALDERAADGAFAFEQAMSRVDTALLEIGRDALPQFVDLLERIVPIAEELVPLFVNIAEFTVDAASGLGSVIGVIGKIPTPALQAGTALGGIASSLLAFSKFGGPKSQVVVGLLAITGVLAAVGRAADTHRKSIDAFRLAFEEAAAAADGVGDPDAPLFVAIEELVDKGITDQLRGLGVEMKDLVPALAGGRDALQDFVDTIDFSSLSPQQRRQFTQLSGDLGDIAREAEKAREEYEASLPVQDRLAIATGENADEYFRLQQEIGKTVFEYDPAIGRVREMTLAEQAQIRATAELGDEYGNLENKTFSLQEQQEEIEEQIKALTEEYKRQRQAVLDLAAANLEAANPVLQYVSATDDLAEAQQALADLDPGASDEERRQAILAVIEAQGRMEAAQGAFALGVGVGIEAIETMGVAAGLTAEQIAFLTGAIDPLDEKLRQQFNFITGEILETGLFSPIDSVRDEASKRLQEALKNADWESVAELDISDRIGPMFADIEFDQDAVENLEEELLGADWASIANLNLTDLIGVPQVDITPDQDALDNLKEALRNADWASVANLEIPGVNVPLDINVIPRYHFQGDPGVFDVPGFGDTLVPEGTGSVSVPAGGGGSPTQNNTFVFENTNGGGGGAVEESIEEVVTSPAVQARLGGLIQ